MAQLALDAGVGKVSTEECQARGCQIAPPTATPPSCVSFVRKDGTSHGGDSQP